AGATGRPGLHGAGRRQASGPAGPGPPRPGQEHPAGRARRGSSRDPGRNPQPDVGARMSTIFSASRERKRPEELPEKRPEAETDSGRLRSRLALGSRLAVSSQGRYWLLAVVSLLGMGWLKGINLLLLLGYLMLVLWGMNCVLAGRAL